MENFKALVRDTVLSKNPEGTWHWAKNVLLTKKLGSVANEDGNKFQYLVPGTVVGFIATNFHVVYFHKNILGVDEIGVVNTNNDSPVYKTIVKSNLFNFQLNCPIEGIFVYNYKNELIVSWCDGVYDNSNSPKVLNLDNPAFDLNPDGTLVDDTQFYNINLTPNKKQGNMAISYIEGASLPGYMAYISMTYINNDDSIVGYFQSSDIAYLGMGFGFISKKGLALNFTDLDTAYTRLRIALVFKLGGDGEDEGSSIAGYESEIFTYTGTSLQLNITSLNNFLEKAPDDILLESTIFEKVKTMTKVDNQAHIGNVVTTKRFNFQKFASLIKMIPIEYLSEDTEYNEQDASFLPDEVYSFYIQLQFLNGSFSEAFHIPGRTAEGTETDILSPAQKSQYDLAWIVDDASYKQFHLLNEGFANNFEAGDDTLNKFGYWENTETYPVDDQYNSTIDYEGNAIVGGEDLRGTPIRYHRFPSVRSMATLNAGYRYPRGGMPAPVKLSDTNPNNPYRVRRRGRKYGIKITNIADIIPSDILAQIQGYRICHVKRNNSNNYVAGNWIATRRKDVDDGRTMVDPDGFWESYDFDTYPTDSDGFNVDFERVRVLGNELFKFRPSLTPVYMQLNYSYYLYDDGSIDNPVLLNLQETDIDRFSQVFGALNYRPGNSPFNNTDFHEEGVNMDLKPKYLGRDSATFDPPPYGGNPFHPYPYLQYYILNITAYLHNINVYAGFKSDSLNIVGRTGTIANNTVFKGGDNFNATEIDIYVRSRIKYPNPNYYNGAAAFLRARRSIHIYVQHLNSPVNVSRLYNPERPDRDETNPIYLATYQYEFDVEEKRALSSIHDVNAVFTFDLDAEFINRFPYRVYRGLKQPNESLTFAALTTFPISTYYEMPNDKGEIIVLRGKERALYIQMRFSLFIAGIKDVLKTGEVNAYLGRGDLFERAPEEILGDDKGYIGCVSQFAAIIIKDMFITVNQVNGQIFIVRGNQASEITAKGNKAWFWNNWDNGLAYFFNDISNEKRRIDNPYVSVGHITGYDKEYNRLIFVKRFYRFLRPDLLGTDVQEGVINFDGEFYTENGVYINFDNPEYFLNLSRALSFSIEDNTFTWVCEHDYKPNFFFYTSNGFFSGLNNLTGSIRTSIYKHNNKDTKGLFFGVKYRSYIDLVFNQDSNITKLLHSIMWLTDVHNNNNGVEQHKTITDIMVYNNTQCSGVINLKNNHFVLTRNANREWNFNDFRDMVINPSNPIIDERGELIQSNINLLGLWFEKSNFIDKFIVVRLIMDNIDNDTIYINQVNVKSVISTR